MSDLVFLGFGTFLFILTAALREPAGVFEGAQHVRTPHRLGCRYRARDLSRRFSPLDGQSSTSGRVSSSPCSSCSQPALPLGGYVKFLEDANNASMLDEAALGIAGSVGVTAGDNQRDKAALALIPPPATQVPYKSGPAAAGARK
jgi:hypothetical protein